MVGDRDAKPNFISVRTEFGQMLICEVLGKTSGIRSHSSGPAHPGSDFGADTELLGGTKRGENSINSQEGAYLVCSVSLIIWSRP